MSRETIASVTYSKHTSHEQIVGTLIYLRKCQARRDAIAQYPEQARQAGAYVSYTNDPTWLVHMAINRRAGWPDDPSLSRGSAMPIVSRDGQWLSYPKRAQGDEFTNLWRLSRLLNGTRCRERVGNVPVRYRARLAHRLTDD